MAPQGIAPAASMQHWSAAKLKRAVAAMLLPREDDECSPQPNINLCEKPGISTAKITWIVVGSVFGALIICTLSVLAFLHRRKKKRDASEDKSDRFQAADYGLDDVPSTKRSRAHDIDSKFSPEGSPSGFGRRSRDPLDAPKEAKLSAAQLNDHLDPFDDLDGTNNQWPKRDSSRGSPLRGSPLRGSPLRGSPLQDKS
ncbi:hypothetical protein QC764_503210 [Podospora pseudoanserina]|uniref:Uncharacterized protein n=1 Tax=Podospora pseudoanserina TaxID=2609844 RepID=A0ABR0I4K6_9PEZI|nr:hypothetical protein QC764_503210 [Podospora pseudoanserina]